MLSGCSSGVTPEKSARIDPQKTGLVLVTIDRSGSPDTEKATIEFPLRRVDQPDGSFTHADVSTRKGLWLVEVPPGRYEIAYWNVAARFGRSEFLQQKFEFDVRPGQVTYIGHLDVEVLPILNRQGERMNTQVRPTLESKLDESVADFHLHYPALANVPIENAAPKKFALYPTTVVSNIPTTSTVTEPWGHYWPEPMPTKPEFLNR
jgi:hypothetical protein